jgi:hypothetical protein
LNDAVPAFQQVQGLQGRVFLVGEIVQQGGTTDEVEVALTDGGDRQVIADQVPFKGRLRFHSVEGEPTEPFVEVTPGADPVPQGLGGAPSGASAGGAAAPQLATV